MVLFVIYQATSAKGRESVAMSLTSLSSLTQRSSTSVTVSRPEIMSSPHHCHKLMSWFRRSNPYQLQEDLITTVLGSLYHHMVASVDGLFCDGGSAEDAGVENARATTDGKS